MTTAAAKADPLRLDLLSAALVVALDGAALGGVQVRARLGPAREAWLDLLVSLVEGARWPRIAAGALREAIGGGLDLTQTLAAGRPVQKQNLLDTTPASAVVICSAERLSNSDAAHLVQALDCAGEQRSLIVLDEGIDEEAPPAALCDHLGLLVLPDAVAPIKTDRWAIAAMRQRIAKARRMLADVRLSPQDRETLAATAVVLDVVSLRPLAAAARTARCLAALDGTTQPNKEHLATAVRLALLPRARRLPTQEQAASQDMSPQPPPPCEQASGETSQSVLSDVVLDAALASIPPHLLAQLINATRRSNTSDAARRGADATASRHGRPTGPRPGTLDKGRLDVLATLRNAAPWQRVRGRAVGAPLALRRDDLRIKRHIKPTGTTHIFLVDASGSTALNRLAEAKGAVELLLADCYVRRDRAALIVFRSKRADLLLPPTRALARAKRALAAMPGGGGTPLASGLLMAAAVAAPLRRQNEAVDVVVLTDGRANIDLEGRAGRAKAEADATTAARALKAAAIPCLVIDTSPRPDPAAQRLATALGARHLPLPFADARTLSSAVRQARPVS